MAQVFILLRFTPIPLAAEKLKPKIYLFKTTFSYFKRLIFQNHFKDTPREAAAA
jgi:hypothetical protein